MTFIYYIITKFLKIVYYLTRLSQALKLILFSQKTYMYF